jgi:hypothetical protein
VPLAAQEPDETIPLSRRTPIAVPGFGAPPPPAESHAAVDEYFERLDEAFATLQQAPAAAAPEQAQAEAAAPAGSSETAAPAGSSETTAPPAKAPAPAPGIAQAFAALFAAERGETAAEIPTFIGPSPLAQVSADDLAERVTRQVLERLSDRVVRDTVTDIVSQVAERLVRDEIERVKATLK